VQTYHWKFFDEGYNFALDFIAIGGLHAKLWAPKVTGILIVGILIFPFGRVPLGSPGTKSHLDVAPVERCRVYYKGEGGGFPQVRAILLEEQNEPLNREKMGLPRKGVSPKELTNPCSGIKVVSPRKIISHRETLRPRTMMFLGIGCCTVGKGKYMGVPQEI
jgi:hypothetical protein